MNTKSAQGSLEYLLIIGAAVLVVAIGIAGIGGLIQDTNPQASTSDYNTQIQGLGDLKTDSTLDSSSGSVSSQTKKGTGTIDSFLINEVSGKIEGKTIFLTLPQGTAIDSLSPVIAFKGSDLEPTSGTAMDFSSPVTYIVTDEKGNQTKYKVYVSVEQPESDSSNINIDSFTIQLEPYFADIKGVVDNEKKTVSFSLPINIYNEYKNSSDENIYLPAAVQTNESAANPIERDLLIAPSAPAVFTVLDQNGKSKEYTVSMALTERSLSRWSGISSFYINEDYASTVFFYQHTDILVELDDISLAASLTPIFTIDKNATSTIISGQPLALPNPFDSADPFGFTVTAEDGISKTNYKIIFMDVSDSNWSRTFDAMKLEDANSYCQSVGKRLPNLKELTDEMNAEPERFIPYKMYWSNVASGDRYITRQAGSGDIISPLPGSSELFKCTSQ